MTDTRPLSERCSLMAEPGGPPPPKERPSECPKDAAYIRGGGAHIINVKLDIPIIFEGDDGDDVVTVVGEHLASSQDGRKSAAEVQAKVAVGSAEVPTSHVSSWGTASMLIALAIIVGASAMVAWRALAPDR